MDAIPPGGIHYGEWSGYIADLDKTMRVMNIEPPPWNSSNNAITIYESIWYQSLDDDLIHSRPNAS